MTRNQRFGSQSSLNTITLSMLSTTQLPRLLLFIGIGIVAVAVAAAAEEEISPDKTSCADTCQLRFRCSPYHKDYVWTLIDNKCRVFQNGCVFSTANCSRVNDCLPEMVKTSQSECQAKCASDCSGESQPICAHFPYTADDGTSDFKQITFDNRCLLDKYACEKAHAYVNDPFPGACS